MDDFTIINLQDLTSVSGLSVNDLVAIGQGSKELKKATIQQLATILGVAESVVIGNKEVEPTVPSFAFAEQGVYPEWGNTEIEGDLGILIYDGTNFSKTEISFIANGVVEEGNTQAVSGGEVFEKLDYNKIENWTAKEYTAGKKVIHNGQIWTASTDTLVGDAPSVSSVWIPELNVVEYNPNADYLHIFQDADGAVVASIDNLGNFSFYVDESQKQYLLSDLSNYLSEIDIKNINLIKEDADEEYIFKLTDAEDKVIFSIDKNGLAEGYFKNDNPSPSSNVNFTDILVNKIPIEGGAEYEVESTEIIVDKISLPTIAVGRESSEGADDAPTIPLTNKGLAHPSVVYVEGGWNGWKYWLVFTPYFNPIPGDDYENPHILVSNDGKTFQEPAGISNPLDVVNASPSTDYWSDTHLKLGDDGYLHLWYRGNYRDIDGVMHHRVYVHKKSRDGINWSDRTITYTTSEGIGRYDNLCLSPAFLKNGTKWLLYDVFKVIDGHGLQITGNSTNNQTRKFVMRRMSDRPDKDYEDYNANQVVNFKNRPWGVTNDVWHLDVQEFGNGFFALLSVGAAEGGGSESLWLAYSGDGWNFTVVEEPLMATLNYRSCMVFKGYEEGKITLDVYAGNQNGEIQLQKLILKKK